MFIFPFKLKISSPTWSLFLSLVFLFFSFFSFSCLLYLLCRVHLQSHFHVSLDSLSLSQRFLNCHSLQLLMYFSQCLSFSIPFVVFTFLSPIISLSVSIIFLLLLLFLSSILLIIMLHLSQLLLPPYLPPLLNYLSHSLMVLLSSPEFKANSLRK